MRNTVKYVVDTKAVLTSQRNTVAALSGLPKRATDIHPAAAALVPATYSPGAFGWTDQALSEPIPSGLTFVLEVTPEAEPQAQAALTASGKGVLLTEAEMLAAVAVAVSVSPGVIEVSK